MENNQITIGSVVRFKKGTHLYEMHKSTADDLTFIVTNIESEVCTLQYFKDGIKYHKSVGSIISYKYIKIGELEFIEQRAVQTFKFIGYKYSGYIRIDQPIVKEFTDKTEAWDYFNLQVGFFNYWLAEILVISEYKNHKAFSCRKYLKPGKNSGHN